MYQLQVNNSGAWKRVCAFGAEDAQAVKDAARVLYRINSHASWRIVDDSTAPPKPLTILCAQSEHKWQPWTTFDK